MGLAICRIQVSGDACHNRHDMATRVYNAAEAGLGGSAKLAARTMKDRNPTDALRVASRHLLEPWKRFITGTGETARIMAAEPTGNGFALDIHVQTRKEKVDYSPRVGRLTYNEETEAPSWEWDSGSSEFPQIAEALSNPGHILKLGKENLFAKDLYRLAEELLGDKCPKVWRGLWVMTSDEEITRAQMLAEQVLQPLDRGSASLKMMRMEDSPTNREHLAGELAEAYRERIETIAEGLAIIGPNVPKWRKEFDATVEEIMTVGEALGVTIPVIDELEAVEVTLLTLEAEHA